MLQSFLRRSRIGMMVVGVLALTIVAAACDDNDTTEDPFNGGGNGIQEPAP